MVSERKIGRPPRYTYTGALTNYSGGRKGKQINRVCTLRLEQSFPKTKHKHVNVAGDYGEKRYTRLG